jgi:hypothetical protein
LGVVTAAVASVTSTGCGGDDDKGGAGGKAGSAGAAGRGGSGGSAGSSGSGGSGGTAGGGGSDAGRDAASDARPDGCPIARLGCADLGKAIDGSGFNTSTNVLRVVLLRGASDVVSGSVRVSLPNSSSGSCASEAVTITAPVSVNTGALQVDLSTHGIGDYISNRGGFRSCGPAVFTLADQCGDSQVIQVEASYFTEGGTLNLTCAPTDAGADATSDPV